MAAAEPAEAFAKPELPFAEEALAKKGISKETIEYHYGKHHLGYWRKLNIAAASDSTIAGKTIEDHIKTSEGKVFNLAAQIWNHSFYWSTLSGSVDGLDMPADSKLAARITNDFGSFDNFKTSFTTTAAGHFGSGWVWLSWSPTETKLVITEGHDAVNPIRDGLIPLLTIDVWEHAYYIDQQNDRGAYIAAWWSCVNFRYVAEQYDDKVNTKVIKL